MEPSRTTLPRGPVSNSVSYVLLNSTTLEPIWIRSPSRRTCSPTRVPFTSVPFVEPRSRSVHVPRSLVTSALSRLRTVSSSRTAPNPESAKIATLTAREREIVALTARGLNRRRIAETLFISEATVRNHLSSIFSKLEVSRQFELVFYAQRYGLDKPSSAESLASN